jgi:hypothetical protein
MSIPDNISTTHESRAVNAAEALNTLLDGQQQERFFADSASAGLRKIRCTEVDLVRRAMRRSGMAPQEFLRKACRMYAMRLISMAERSGSGSGGTRGVRGGADERIAKAYEHMIEAGELVTVTALRVRAGTNYRTAQTWLEREHPEALRTGNDKAYARIRRRIERLYPEHVGEFERLYLIALENGEERPSRDVERAFLELMRQQQVESSVDALRPQLMGVYRRVYRQIEQELGDSPHKSAILKRYTLHFEKYAQAGDRHAGVNARDEALAHHAHLLRKAP